MENVLLLSGYIMALQKIYSQTYLKNAVEMSFA